LRTEKPETYEELKAAGFVNEKSWRNLYISKLK
jgi:hypothetical protein